MDASSHPNTPRSPSGQSLEQSPAYPLPQLDKESHASDAVDGIAILPPPQQKSPVEPMPLPSPIRSNGLSNTTLPALPSHPVLSLVWVAGSRGIRKLSKKQMVHFNIIMAW